MDSWDGVLMLEVPSKTEAPPTCPSCSRPLSGVRDASVLLAATSPDDLLVECMTPGCPRFGSRWTKAQLEAEHLAGEREAARPSWDDQFMDIAKITARRATCDRSHVGCVLAVDARIVSTGYNGSFSEADHCDQGGHHMVGDPPRCTRTVHAEMNAVADAARRGVSVEGATAYVTREPCTMCLKLLIAAGVERVVCAEVIKASYLPELEWLAEEGGIDLEYPHT